MSWLTKIFSSGATQLVSSVMDSVGKMQAGHLGKKELQLELEKMIHAENQAHLQLVTAEISAKEKVMVAELTQGDSYTKRARPTIVYVGLAAAVLDGVEAIPFTMPSDFWYVWAGVCGIYMIGRTVEKRGAGGIAGKLAGLVTGSKRPSILADAA